MGCVVPPPPRYYGLICASPDLRTIYALDARSLPNGQPREGPHFSLRVCVSVPPPVPRRIERVRVSIASPLMQPSPNGRRVGIRIVTFEACSDFTRVTARRIAQPPKATFVTRLQPYRLPGRAARQLPDQSTTLWVDSSSTDDSRLRGALPFPDSCTRSKTALFIRSPRRRARAVSAAQQCQVPWRSSY